MSLGFFLGGFAAKWSFKLGTLEHEFSDACEFGVMAAIAIRLGGGALTEQAQRNSFAAFFELINLLHSTPLCLPSPMSGSSHATMYLQLGTLSKYQYPGSQIFRSQKKAMHGQESSNPIPWNKGERPKVTGPQWLGNVPTNVPCNRVTRCDL